MSGLLTLHVLGCVLMRETDLFVKPLNDVALSDAIFLTKHEFALASWDKPAGEMHATWNGSHADQDNTFHDFYPRCTGFQNGKVVDDEGHLFPLDYWTPNGSALIYVPSAGHVQA